MLVDTDIYKTQKEIAEWCGKSQAYVNKEIAKANTTGAKVATLPAFSTTLYDVRTLPKTLVPKQKQG